MKKYIKDNIYGFIKTDLIKIIDNPIFQRLRYIKQNGFCYLIYTCANHTRFEHSLGCFYLTNEAMTKMKDLNKDEREKLRICSLIHDIGHGPFSHISEETLGLNHEKQLFKLLKQILEDTNYSESEIKKVFKSEKFDLVSGDFGTDRLDYLLRDSHNTGVSYGLIDWQLLIKEIKYIDRKYAFSKKIESSLDNIILARHFMFSNVYAHKTAIKIDDGYVTILVDEGGFTKAQTKPLEKEEARKIFNKVLDSGITEFSGKEIKIWADTYPTVQDQLK